MGDFSGHNHDDVFAVSYKLNNDTSLRPIVSTYFAGSVTPFVGKNPGFRVYEIDSVTKAVIDYTEYAANLTLANLQGYPTWEPIYRARADYSLPDMSADSWHNLSVRFGKNQSLLLQYVARMAKDSYQLSCDSSCIHGSYCSLWNPPPDTSLDICGL